MAARFRVLIDEQSWQADLAAASTAARTVADRWRARIQRQGGIDAQELLPCDPAHREFPLERCVKTRLPDPDDPDVRRSPWGVVLQGNIDEHGPYLELIAFGLRHPDAAGSPRPSVYQVAAGRL